VFCIYQLKIDESKNIASLDLNPFFYPETVIAQAKKEFSKLCSFKSNSKNNRLHLEIRVSKGLDAEQTALNFLNFALALRREL
jgi:hypothetical protein